MKDFNGISVVVPAHNAEKIIESSLNSYINFFSKLYKKYEIIVVANACTDSTIDKAKKISKKLRNIRILEIKRRGKGRAILVGFEHAKHDIIGFIDADDVFNHQGIKKMLSFLQEYDCVIASKWLGQKFSEVREPFSRKIFAFGWNILTRSLLRLNLKDTQAGCKFLRKEAIRHISKDFICLGWDFDAELLFKLQKKRYKIKEFFIPITIIFKFSVFKLRYIPGMFWHILRVWNRGK